MDLKEKYTGSRVKKHQEVLAKLNKRICKKPGEKKYNLYLSDLTGNYLYSLRMNGINEHELHITDIRNYGDLLKNYLEKENISLSFKLDEKHNQSFFEEYKDNFKQKGCTIIEVIKDYTITELVEEFHSYLPYDVLGAITSEEVFTGTRAIYDSICPGHKEETKTLSLHKKKNS